MVGWEENPQLWACIHTCTYSMYARTYIYNSHPYFDNGKAVNATQKTNISTTAGALADVRELDERLLLFRRTSFYISMHNKITIHT